MEDQRGINRREFLRAAALTAVGASAIGGGAAAFLRSQSTEYTITALPSATSVPFVTGSPQASINGGAAAVPVQPVVAQAAEPEAMLSQLAQSQAENMQLRAQLDALQLELSSLQQNDLSNRATVENLSLELEGANQRVGVLAGLVALYQQLDDIDPGEVVENGLNALGTSIGDMLGLTPELDEGLAAGEMALADVEAHLPLLDNGRQWLAAQAAKVDGFYSQVELMLQEALERVGDFFEMLEAWFASLQKWLPFGVGEKAARLMSALTVLMAEMPHTISGLDTNIAQPLDVWLAREDGEPRLQRTLIKPVREQVIAKSRATAAQATQVDLTYAEQLAQPARTVLAQRQAIRASITQYRQENQI